MSGATASPPDGGAVNPRISEALAWKLHRVRSPWPPFRRIEIVKVELILLPHYLFSLMLESEMEKKTVEAAVDGVLGHFAIWRPELVEWGEPGAGLRPEFRLSREQAEQRLREDYRWVLIAAGLKLRRRYRIVEVSAGPRFHYPFWVGYRRRRGSLDFEAVDAVTGLRQGGKVRDAVLAALVEAGKRPSL